MKAEFENTKFDSRKVMKQRGKLVEDVPDFKIEPRDIDTSGHLWGAYGNNETEISAKWIIRMCQRGGNSWKPFTQEQIKSFYVENGMRGSFTFNQLVEPKREYSFAKGEIEESGGGWIVKKEDGKYHVTTVFVEAAYRSSPSVPGKQHLRSAAPQNNF